jgi:hypothetical protein
LPIQKKKRANGADKPTNGAPLRRCTIKPNPKPGAQLNLKQFRSFSFFEFLSGGSTTLTYRAAEWRIA